MTDKHTKTFASPARSRRLARDDVEAARLRASPAQGVVFDPPPVVPQPVSHHLQVAFGMNLKAARLERGLQPSDLA